MPPPSKYAVLAEAVRHKIRSELDDEAAIVLPMIGACYNALGSRLQPTAAIEKTTADDDVTAIARVVIQAAAFAAFASWSKDNIAERPDVGGTAIQAGPDTATGFAFALRGMVDALAPILRKGIDMQVAIAAVDHERCNRCGERRAPWQDQDSPECRRPVGRGSATGGPSTSCGGRFVRESEIEAAIKAVPRAPLRADLLVPGTIDPAKVVVTYDGKTIGGFASSEPISIPANAVAHSDDRCAKCGERRAMGGSYFGPTCPRRQLDDGAGTPFDEPRVCGGRYVRGNA